MKEDVEALSNQINKCVTKVKGGVISNGSISFDFTNDPINSIYLVVVSTGRMSMISRYSGSLGVFSITNDVDVTLLTSDGFKLTLTRSTGTSYYALIKVN